MFFSPETLYLGNSLQEFNRIRNLLDVQKIRYKYTVIDHSNEWVGHNTVRGMGGRGLPGEENRIQYEILVKRKDHEKASYLIRQK